MAEAKSQQSGVRIRMLNYITVEAIAQFPIPNSRFPIPDSQFPMPHQLHPLFSRCLPPDL
ncbi:MAG TPA: hypothetical protein DGO89_07510 [Microcoleaceae bacterium UBA9251]|nr:hypothetical protein [Microcoleaceae cyanobacterium UBA9251]